MKVSLAPLLPPEFFNGQFLPFPLPTHTHHFTDGKIGGSEKGSETPRGPQPEIHICLTPSVPQASEMECGRIQSQILGTLGYQRWRGYSLHPWGIGRGPRCSLHLHASCDGKLTTSLQHPPLETRLPARCLNCRPPLSRPPPPASGPKGVLPPLRPQSPPPGSLHQDGYQQVEEHIVAEGHEGNKVESPGGGGSYAVVEDDVPVLL